MTAVDLIAAGTKAEAEIKERGGIWASVAATQFPDGLDEARDFASEARINANEAAAIATLKNISSAQAQLQASGIIDANRNSEGEYGFFAELSGAAPLRKDSAGGVTDRVISPPVLSNAFAAVEASRVVRSGYAFQMFLPDVSGAGTTEAATGGSSRGVWIPY